MPCPGLADPRSARGRRWAWRSKEWPPPAVWTQAPGRCLGMGRKPMLRGQLCPDGVLDQGSRVCRVRGQLCRNQFPSLDSLAVAGETGGRGALRALVPVTTCCFVTPFLCAARGSAPVPQGSTGSRAGACPPKRGPGTPCLCPSCFIPENGLELGGWAPSVTSLGHG